MKNFKRLIFFFLAVTLAIACRNDLTEQDETETGSFTPAVFVSSSFNGFVSDESGTLLENVGITMDNHTVYTDSRGFFQISGKANSTGAYIRAHLDGYFEAYANVLPSADATNHVRFTLKERIAQQAIDSDTDAEILLTNGSQISLAANSFVDASGAPYSGKVTVFADYVDPSSSNFSSVMPGDLSAVSIDNQGVILQSFGMLNIELASASGAPLNINKKATIKVKVPDANLAIANDIIPLWYFDLSDGLWKEEGSAVLTNGYYIGEVSHFTLWNCDAPFPAVTLKGQILSRGPIPFSRVKVTWIESGEMRITYTDSEGFFCGKVPSNALLLVEIIDDCGAVIYSEEIGPLTEDTFMSIYLLPADYDYFTITGTLVCNGDVVSNGYVIIELENGNGLHFAVANEQGVFATELLNCNASNLTIYGIDIDSGEQGDAEVIAIESEMVIDELSVCGTAIEYKAVYIYNNTEYVVDNPIIFSIVDNSYLINVPDTNGIYQANVQYYFGPSANNGNWIMSGSFSVPIDDDDHFVINATLPAELQETPGNVIFTETPDYVEFYVPIATISEYAFTSANYVLYEGSFLLRAQK